LQVLDVAAVGSGAIGVEQAVADRRLDQVGTLSRLSVTTVGEGVDDVGVVAKATDQVSLPVPPSSLPSSVSLPVPPMSVSLPKSPRSRSLPAPPSSESLSV
jgi:hypothetical protein